MTSRELRATKSKSEAKSAKLGVLGSEESLFAYEPKLESVLEPVENHNRIKLLAA